MLLFNRYEYQPQTDLIATGESTRVYKALDKHIYLPVAVKFYNGDFPVERSRLMQAKTLMDLDHPNICRYLHIRETEQESNAGQKEKTLACVMELLEDGDLVTYYRSRRQPELLRRMLTDVLHGLAYLHSRGFIHKRLKPSNLLVGETTQGPVVKITDFGLGMEKAVLRDARFSPTVVDGMQMVSEPLNAHEYGNNKKVSWQPDLRALGFVAYEALADDDGIFRHRRGNGREPMMRHTISPAKVQRLPAPFDSFVERCLSSQVNDRAQNTWELLALLAQPIVPKHDVDDPLALSAMTVEEEEEVEEDVPAREVSVGGGRIEEDRMEEDPVEGERIVEDRVTQDRVVDEQVVQKLVVQKQVVQEQVVQEQVVQEQVVQKLVVQEQAVQEQAVVPAKEVLAPVEVKPGETRAPVEAKAAEAKTPEAKAPEAIVIKVQNEENHSLFNRYEYDPKKGLIGKGGFSRVYKAFDKKLDRWVALKFFTTWEFSDRHSTLSGIRRVIGLDHPNICRYLDIEEIEKENAFGEKETLLVCVMELLDGGNLFDYYTAHPMEEGLKKLLTGVLQGLDYLHKNGIVHGDLKPANILIRETYSGPVAKITDFGAGTLSGRSRNSSTSPLVVSIPHIAPEQLDVKKYAMNEEISYNLDFWALGVTIYEVITGKALFMNSDDDSSEQIMANITAPGLPEKITELPQPFLDVVRRCVVKNARDRAQQAEELIALLNRKEVEAGPVPVEAGPEVSETVAVGPEPAAIVVEPAVVEEKPAAIVVESVPVVAEPVPLEPEPVLVPVEPETVPVPVEPETPAIEVEPEPAAVAAEPEPIAEEPAPAEAGPKPQTPGSRPWMSEPRTWVAEPNPEVLESKPWMSEPGRWAAEPRPWVMEPKASTEMQEEMLLPAKKAQPAYAGILSGWHKRWDAGLGIAVAAVAVVLMISLYVYTQNRRLNQQLGSFSKSAEPAHIDTHEPAAMRPVAASTTPPARARRTNAVRAGGKAAGAAVGTEKDLYGESGEDGRAGTKEKAEATAAAPAKYVLLLTTPRTCSIDINDASYGMLESGKTMKVYLVPGNYLLRAKSAGHGSTVFTQRLFVRRKNLNHWKRYRIPL